MGHLNGILARVGGNLNKTFQKSQMPGGLPGGRMLKLRFDRYISGSLGTCQKLAGGRGGTEGGSQLFETAEKGGVMKNGPLKGGGS